MKLYVDVVQRWRGTGLKFLFVFLMAASIPFSIALYPRIKGQIDEVSQAYQQFPTLNVVDGKVEFDKSMPYIIRDDKTNQPFIIVDTSGRYKTLSNVGLTKTAFMLITKTKIYTRTLVQDQPLEQAIPNVTATLDGNTMQMINQPYVEALPYMMYPLIVIVTFAVSAFIFFAVSMLLSFMSKVIFKYQLNFKRGLRLTYVAACPALAANFFIIYINYTDSKLGLILFGVLMFYFIVGVLANKFASKQLVKV